MAKVASSKTNPNRKRGLIERKKHNGQDVFPVEYFARHGENSARYIAAKYANGDIVEDGNGNPVKWNSIKSA